MSDLREDQVARAVAVLASLREGGAERVGGFLHEQVVMEAPFSPEGVTNRVEGRAATIAALHYIDLHWKYFRIVPHQTYHCRDRDTVIVEATSIGRSLDGRPDYQNRYVFLFRFAGDLIVSWREYFNPYPVAWMQVSRRT